MCGGLLGKEESCIDSTVALTCEMGPGEWRRWMEKASEMLKPWGRDAPAASVRSETITEGRSPEGVRR